MDKENVPLRFEQASEDDVERILSAKTPKSTKYATAFWVKVFTDYIASGPSAGMDLKTAERNSIAKVLELFYVNIRKKDQTLYKRNSYLLARSAIHRHLMSIRDDIDLFSSAEFKRSNEVLDGVLKEKKGEESAVHHKDSITDADWKLIKEYFTDIQDTLDPRKLCSYVWFHVSSKFCLRGREVQTNMKKTDIELRVVEGKEVFSLHQPLLFLQPLAALYPLFSMLLVHLLPTRRLQSTLLHPHVSARSFQCSSRRQHNGWRVNIAPTPKKNKKLSLQLNKTAD